MRINCFCNLANFHQSAIKTALQHCPGIQRTPLSDINADAGNLMVLGLPERETRSDIGFQWNLKSPLSGGKRRSSATEPDMTGSSSRASVLSGRYLSVIRRLGARQELPAHLPRHCLSQSSLVWMGCLPFQKAFVKVHYHVSHKE